MISILMPVKNAAPFLTECIESILRQTNANWELIAVDDHSADTSKNILDSFAEFDQRIKVLSNSSNGIIPALNLAFHKAQGPFITRMDADDRMLPNKLELLHQVLSTQSNHSIAVAQVKYFSDTVLGNGYIKYAKWLNELTAHERHYQEIYKECTIPSIAWMSTKETLHKIDAFGGDMYPEDYAMAFKCCYHKIKILPVKKIVHEWRDHSNRSSRNDPNYLNNQFLAIKVKWFFKIHFQTDKKLILWGAGKKGKAIARLLQNQVSDFLWISNNVNKIGHVISSIEIKEQSILDELENPQIIIAVANTEEQDEIRKTLSHLHIDDCYFFC